MSVIINGTTGVTSGSGQFDSASTFGFKNRIINGAMMIDQRNAGASVTPSSGATYTLDRWAVYASQASKFSVQQNAGSVTPPAGFSNYLGITSTSSYSLSASDIFEIYQSIEGLNSSDLGFGTASAKTVTLSFWVRSSLTGTFGGALSNSASNRYYPFSYTISSANTWQQISLTIVGDIAGTWLTNNGIGITAIFSFGVGSTYSGTTGSWGSSVIVAPTGNTSVVGTSGATFYITGVQLEKGSTATSFDYRPYGTELALCQRYYWNIGPVLESFQGFVAGGATGGDAYVRYPVPMRASPAITYTSLANYSVFVWNTSTAKTPTSITLIYSNTIKGVLGINWSGATGTVGTGFALDINSTEVLQFSAEL